MARGRLVACVAAAVFAVVGLGGQAPVTVSGQASPRDPAVTVRSMALGTASIQGVVVAADNGQPLANARVGVQGTSGSAVIGTGLSGLTPDGRGSGPEGPVNRVALTDDRGHFAIELLPAGQFMITVQRPGFLNTAYGANQPNRPGTLMRLTDGQRLEISIKMLRGGVIGGTAYAPDGAPLISAQVRASRYGYTSGVKRLMVMGTTQTDDRGAYRIHSLVPGDYLVSIVPNISTLSLVDRTRTEIDAFESALADARRTGTTPTSVPITMPSAVQGPPPGYAPTYFPAASTASEAATITLGPGEERLGVDVSMMSVRTTTIAGLVGGIPPSTAAQVSLVNQDPGGDSMISGARTDPAGAFTLRNIVPGRYLIAAQTVPLQPAANGIGPVPGPNAIDASQRLWAQAEVTIDGQSDLKLVLTLRPGRSISGAVVFDGVTSPVGSTRVTLTPSPAGGMVPIGGMSNAVTPDPDGRFRLDGVFPGRYVLRATPGFVKASIVDGQDTLDMPLVIDGDRDITNAQITLTSRSSELSGTFSEASGVGVSGYTIVIASSERRYWVPGSRRITTTRPGSDGRFIVRGLPAGDYLLAAVTDLEPGQQYDPAFLAGLAGGAVQVTVTDGGRHVQDIRLAR